MRLLGNSILVVTDMVTHMDGDSCTLVPCLLAWRVVEELEGLNDVTLNLILVLSNLLGQAYEFDLPGFAFCD